MPPEPAPTPSPTLAPLRFIQQDLTGGLSGQVDWHMLAAVVVDGEFYFVDPQNDKVFRKDDR